MPYSRVLFFRGPQAASRATRALGVVVVAGLVILTLLSTLQLRSQAETAARTSAEDHAYATSTHAYQAFAAADSIASGVVRAVTARRITDAAQFDAELGAEDEQRLLAARQSSFEGIDVVSVVDANGHLLNTSLKYPPPTVDMHDREGFQTALRRTADAPHIAAPVQNRVDGRWTIYVSRRLSSAHGQFLGAVFVGLSPKYFSDFYANMRPDQVSRRDLTAITLLRNDGIVMARSPYDERLLGRAMNSAGHYRTLMNTPTDTARSGESYVDGPFEPWDAEPDDEGRVMVTSRRVDRFPFTLAVAMHEDFYLANWRRQAEATAALTGVAVLFLLGTFATLVRVLQRRERHLVEVEQLRVSAEKASQAKTNFLATVSHEVRTPLNGILGTAELLLGTDLQPQQQELAGTLLISGRNLLAIINDILDLSKIEADELSIEVGPFSPRSVVHDVLSLFASYASGKGLGLSMHADNQVPAVLAGDAKRVKQVIGNLVSNAIKFSDIGEVRVTLTWPVHEDGIHVLRIEVCDNGVGVPEEARERVFQAFGQADGSISRRFGGTGLGLTISKRLIKLMGGQIDFTSRAGAGTCFWVELPLPETSAPVSEAAHEHSDWTFAHSGPMPLPAVLTERTTTREDAHVLVVEDNTINAMVVEAQLRRLGCTCDIAADGEEAIQRLSTGSYRLVLMDCMLPGISGFETTRRWRVLEAERGMNRLPIIALTANALASNLAETHEAGMDDFLTKPCTLDKLEAALRIWLKPNDAVSYTAQHKEALNNSVAKLPPM